MFNKKTLRNLTIRTAGLPLMGISSDAGGSETEKSKTTRRRTVEKRDAEDDVSVASKKERRKCTDLSFVSPSPETISVELDPGLRLWETGVRARTSTDCTDRHSGVLYTAGPRGLQIGCK